jgi:heme/copper-type cytochrome/quinol oxidase subunit 4
MKSTSIGLLIKFACAAIVVGWALNAALWWFGNSGFHIGAGSPLVTAACDIALLMWTLHVRTRLPRVQKQADNKVQLIRATNPLSPLVAARTALLALASSRAGSLLVGLYLGLAAAAAMHMNSESGRTAVGLELLTAALALVLVVIALWLERLCKLPKPPAESVDAAESA